MNAIDRDSSGPARIGWIMHPDGWAYVPNRVLCPIPIPADLASDLGITRVDGDAGRFGVYVRRGGDSERTPLDVARTVSTLRALGIPAQPDHVLFLDGACTCCCPPHPSALWPDACGNIGPANASLDPRSRVNAALDPRSRVNATLDPRSPVNAGNSARPAADPGGAATVTGGAGSIRVTVLDTAFADTSVAPNAVGAASIIGDAGDRPDVMPNPPDGLLDSCAGHATFIAGIIARLVPGAQITVKRIADPDGAIAESQAAAIISGLAMQSDPPHYLNLSFSGASWNDQQMGALETAVNAALDAGIAVVASVGNDASCTPMFPAAFDGVVSVGALGPAGPAPFTNYGNWVRSCAPGVDIVSWFFRDFDGAEQPVGGVDPDAFNGWARWSGTSFSTPLVVAALARHQAATGCTPAQAVSAVIDAPGLVRIANLGTVVNIWP